MRNLLIIVLKILFTIIVLPFMLVFGLIVSVLVSIIYLTKITIESIWETDL